MLDDTATRVRVARNGDRVDLLERDRELGRTLAHSPHDPPAARLWASVVRLERGSWEPPVAEPEPAGEHLGYLVLDGLIGRRIMLPKRGRSLELLGGGDLFRPWQEDSASFSEVTWTVLQRATLAALEGPFAARARREPELLEALTERALRRSRRLAVSAAIANTVGVEERLLLILWQLTELWGRRADGGVVLPYRLSHQTLADLVGARRPTVTLALRNLASRKLVRRGERGEWMLAGAPP